jgi:glycosyltransferase involved in cell wall biosynthesis
MAIHLTEALKAQGHDAVLWSPHPLPDTRWWQSLHRMRSKVDAFIESEAPFDAIDSPAALITKRMRRSAFVVARSTQPDILYLLSDLKSPFRLSLKNIVRVPPGRLYTLFHMCLVLMGWARANLIICLGTLELDWMKRRFPFWRKKLCSYMNALSGADQAALSAIREQRARRRADSLRFLWIGRWVSHKGHDVLLDFIKSWSRVRPQDTFTIAGCGPEAEKDCRAALPRPDGVITVPSFNRDQLYSLLAENDIGLFTSRVEGWGLVLNEMLESGMPVFSTPAGGTPDLQPFFADRLRPFPPPPQTISDLRNGHVEFKSYYKVFAWESIASGYVNSIRAMMNSR